MCTYLYSTVEVLVLVSVVFAQRLGFDFLGFWSCFWAFGWWISGLEICSVESGGF